MKIILLLLLLPYSAFAAPNCTDNGICEGDHSYVYYKNAIHVGTVQKIVPGKKPVQFLVDGEKSPVLYYSDSVAVTNPKSCNPEDKRICVGHEAPFKLENGTVAKGKISGYFPGFIVMENSGHFLSVKREDLQMGAPAAEDDSAIENAVKLANSTLTEVCKGKETENKCPAHEAKAPESKILALVQRVKAGETPKLHEYLVQWKNTGSSPQEAKNPWDNCHDPSRYGHPIKSDARGYIVPECETDTLYSWGPLKKVTDLASNMGTGKWVELPYFNNALYLSETPMSSFGYGSNDGSGGYAIRIKLKAGVHFLIVPAPPNCQTVGDIGKNTVFVRVFDNNHGGGKLSSGADFILCSSEPVHSWSYGTREFYDELSRDVSRATNPPTPNSWLSYMRRPDATGTYQPSIWDLGSDHHPFTDQQLTNTLKNQLVMSNDNEGKIFYNPDDPGTEAKKREEHFTTKIPNWFNENSN